MFYKTHKHMFKKKRYIKKKMIGSSFTG